MTPTVGRIVHFWGVAGRPQAAIITRVWSPETVNLTVFGDFGEEPTDQLASVYYGTGAGQWSWPERVE